MKKYHKWQEKRARRRSPNPSSWPTARTVDLWRQLGHVQAEVEKEKREEKEARKEAKKKPAKVD